MNYINRLISWLESLKITPLHMVVSFLFVAIFRVLLEQMLLGSSIKSLSFISIHSISFYFGIYFLFLFFISFLFNFQVEKIKNLVFSALSLGLLPPILDFLFFRSFGERTYIYFPSFEPSFFSPEQMIGESVTLWLIILLTTLVVYSKTGSKLKALVGFIMGYCLLQFCSFGLNYFVQNTLSIIDIIGDERSYADFGVVHGLYSLFWIAVGFICMAGAYWDKYRTTLKRVHHTFIFGALVVVGAQMVSEPPALFSLLILIEAFIFSFAFLLAQTENDFYDKKLDALTNRASSLNKDDMYLVRFIQIALILSVAIFDFSIVPFLLLFFTLSFAYSHTKIRLKKHFVTGSLVEGLGCLVCLMAGAYSLYNPHTNILPTHIQSPFPLAIWLFITISLGFAICSNFKDYKDFKGDLKGGITTIYVLLYNKWNIQPQTTNKIIAGIFALSFISLITLSGYLYPYNQLEFSESLMLLIPFAILPILSLVLIKKPKRCVSVTVILIISFLLIYSLQFANRESIEEDTGAVKQNEVSEAKAGTNRKPLSEISVKDII